MKKQILLGTVLVATISYLSLPTYAQVRILPGHGRPGDDRDRGGRPGDGRPNRPDDGHHGRPGRPGDGRPDRPGDGRPGRPGDGRPDRPGDGRPGRPGDGRPDRPGDGRPGRPGDGRPDRPGDGRPGRPGDGRPDRPGRPGYPGYPGPGRPGPRPPRPWPAPAPIPAPDYRDSAFVSSVTRATGGEWFRISFRNSVQLRHFSVTVVSAGVRIHEARAHTWSGGTFYIPQLSPSPVFYSPSTVGASYFANEPVRAIDIRAEGFGGYADLVIEAVGNYETPRMDVSRF